MKEKNNININVNTVISLSDSNINVTIEKRQNKKSHRIFEKKRFIHLIALVEGIIQLIALIIKYIVQLIETIAP